MNIKKQLSEAASLMAKRGGNTTLKKYGIGHYRKMAKKSWSGKRKPKAKK